MSKLKCTATTTLLLTCFSLSTQTPVVDNTASPISQSRKILTSVAEQQLMLFCNVTGPCRPCSAGSQKGKTAASESHHCRHFSHVEDLECEVDLATASHAADVRQEPLQALPSRQRHSRVQHHRGCTTAGQPKTVAWFEFGVVALLLLALPTVIWRKHILNANRG